MSAVCKSVMMIASIDIMVTAQITTKLTAYKMYYLEK